jgi:hypothetical protein
MKKSIMFFMMMFALILPTFGQSIEPQPPSDWLSLFANINVWLGSLAGIAAVTVFLAATMNKLFKFEGFIKQVTAWVIAILLMVIGNLVNLGFMAEMNWLHTIIYGVAAGFISNGIFDIAFVRLVLQTLKIEAKE